LKQGNSRKRRWVDSVCGASVLVLSSSIACGYASARVLVRSPSVTRRRLASEGALTGRRRRAQRRGRQGRDRIINLRGADYVTTRRLLDRDEALRRLETRLGPLHAQLRLGMEREHEAQAFGQGLSFLHLENLPLMQAMIEIALRVTGTYWRGRANAGKVQLRRNTVHLANLPSAFDGFTILHLSDLHADLSGPAMERVADLAHDLAYDLCVLTGDYRGRTHGDFEPCLEIFAHVREALRGDIYGVLGNHDSIAMVPKLEALGVRVLLNECVAIRSGSASIYLAGVDDAHFYRADNIEKAGADIPHQC